MRPLAREEIMSDWYLASLVRRWHTWPVIRIETVAEHSHGVATLYLRYFEDSAKLYEVRWILENDLAELWTGDAPFPAKIRFPSLGAAHREAEVSANAALRVIKPDLSLAATRRIKACDLLQMNLFGLHEMRMGNTYALPIVRDTLTAAAQVVAGDNFAVEQISRFTRENHQ